MMQLKCPACGHTGPQKEWKTTPAYKKMMTIMTVLIVIFLSHLVIRLTGINLLPCDKIFSISMFIAIVVLFVLGG